MLELLKAARRGYFEIYEVIVEDDIFSVGDLVIIEEIQVDKCHFYSDGEGKWGFISQHKIKKVKFKVAL